MQALQKRFQRWENHNHYRLKLITAVSRKQTLHFVQLASFLLYLAYKGGHLLMKAFRILWIQPRDLEKRIQEADQKRLELNTLPNHWLK